MSRDRADRGERRSSPLRYPFRGPESTGTLAVGSLLLLVGGLAALVPIWQASTGSVRVGLGMAVPLSPAIVLPWLLLVGFAVAVLRRTIGGELRPPRFDSWGRRLADGVRGTVVIGLFALPVVIALVTIRLVGPLELPSAQSGLGTVLLIGYVVSASYPALLSLCAVADDGLVGAASLRLAAVGTSGPFAVGWLAAIGAGAVAVTVAVPLSATVVGIVSLFYVGTVALRVVGRGYRKGSTAARSSDAPTR